MLDNIDPFSAELSGSLRSVFEKLLRYCNDCSYIILPVPKTKIGIERLIILKSPHELGTSQGVKPALP
jgi:hypothetical protein